MANEFKQFMGLLIFGNIENLILSAQGATAHVDPFILGGLSLICVVCWLLIGTFGTKFAIKYARHINFIVGIQSMIGAIPGMLKFF